MFSISSSASLLEHPSMKISTRKLLLVAALAIVSSVSLLDNRASAQKPGPPPAPLPPVRYKLTVFTMPSAGSTVFDMNNHGELVGYYQDAANLRHAFVIDPAAGSQVIDLGTLVTPPDGWYVSTAYGINDQGSIVGALGQVGISSTDRRRGFVIHRPAVGPAVLELLPDSGWNVTYGEAINEDGTVLGIFHSDTWYGAYVYDPQRYGLTPQVLPFTAGIWNLRLNNSMGVRPAQVAGALPGNLPFVYTLGAVAPVTYPGLDPSAWLDGINDAGTFCGGVNYTQSKPRLTRKIAFRYGATYQQFPVTSSFASSINLAGDMAIPANSSGTSSPTQLYSEGYGVMDLDSLMVGNAADLELWKNRYGRPLSFEITERGSLNPAMPGYPAMGGYFTYAGVNPWTNYAFTLTPVAP